MPDQTERERQLERALKSKVTELPENKPRGILGERNPDLRKVDDEWEPDLNSGISQEVDLPVVWMGVMLGYLLGFVPGFVVLWRTHRISLRNKIIWTVIGVLGAVAIVWGLAGRK